MRTSCFVLRWCRYRSLSAPGVAAGLLLACLLTVIPLTGAFAASTRQATPPQQKNLDRAGVSVVRLLVTYTENVQQTSCTGLGALIRSWPSQSGSERNTWILTDGNLVNVSGTIPCVPTRTSARLTSIQIFLSSAYSDAQATISLTVPSEWKVDCQNSGDCSRGPALISFHSATLFPYLDISATSAASSTPSSGASGKSSDVPLSTLVLKRTNTTGSSVDLPPFSVDEQQAVRFLTPALLPMPTEATNVKNGTPVVDEAGNLAGIYLSTSGTEPLLVREFDNFVQSRIPQDIPANVVHDGWNEGITAFYTNDKKSAQAAFKQVVNANPQFQGAQDFLNASNPGSNGNRTPAPTPSVNQGDQGNIISFLLPLIGIAVLVVLVGLLLLASVLFGRSRLRRKREIREALAEAPLQARRIKEMEAMQQEREQPVGARSNNPGVGVGRNAAASPHRTAPLPAQDWRCPRCSEPVPAGANYCSRCRLPLSPSESGLHLKVAPQQSLPQSDIPAAPASPVLSPAGVPASYPLAQFPPFSPSPPSAGSVADQPTLDMSSADQPTLDMSPTLQGNKADDADMPTVPYVMQRRQKPLGYSIVTRTNRGIKRQHKPNEDSLVAATGGRMSNHALQLFGLFVVADGMGGHANGQDASRLAIQTIVNYILPELMRDTGQQSDGFRRILKEGVEHANIAVHQQNLEQHGDMGTTITAALTVETTAYIANVGDSRTYLYRQAEGLIKITQDHSVVASLVDAGIIKPDDIYTHPKRNQIYRSLGEKPAIEVDTFVVQLQEGDRLLLCSDGLWDMVRDPQISDVIRSTTGNLELMGDALIQAALDGGGEDNVSIILVQVAETAQRPLKAGVQFLARPDTMQVPQID